MPTQPTPGLSNSEHHIYATDEATHVGRPVDSFESERIEWVPLSHVCSLIEKRDIVSGTTLAVAVCPERSSVTCFEACGLPSARGLNSCLRVSMPSPDTRPLIISASGAGHAHVFWDIALRDFVLLLAALDLARLAAGYTPNPFRRG
jgi:hypothetical protein